MNKKRMVKLRMILLLGIILFYFFNLHNVSAVGQTTNCCERTTSGAWCQNVPDTTQCDTSNGNRVAPTSCDATSYCQLGTCVNSQQGLCMSNVPQRQCTSAGPSGTVQGTWYNTPSNQVPQCQLGCCLLGDQAAFTTQTSCKQLSSLYGLQTNYRTDIKSETECIASAFPQAKGACVFTQDFQTTCKFTTKKDCQSLQTGNATNTTFYQNFLCSNAALGTNCGPSTKTTLINGQDQIFFVDTCGNPANVYDSRYASGKSTFDQKYWDTIQSSTCNLISGSNPVGNAASCGNCNYLTGSTGKQYDRSKDPIAPNFGNYVCRNLGCSITVADKEGNAITTSYQNGETWCARNTPGVTSTSNLANALGTSNIMIDSNTGILTSDKTESPGGRDFRMVCYNGEITVEPCTDFRQQVCVQSSIPASSGSFPSTTGSFSTAACRVNKWQDCSSFTTASTDSQTIARAQASCNDNTTRDCQWVDNSFVKTTCEPRYSPGFDFWSNNSQAASFCSQGNVVCTVTYQQSFSKDQAGAFSQIANAVNYYFNNQNTKYLNTGIQGTVTCLDNNGNIVKQWVQDGGNFCTNLGDCGVNKNFLGTNGQYGNYIVNTSGVLK